MVGAVLCSASASWLLRTATQRDEAWQIVPVIWLQLLMTWLCVRRLPDTRSPWLILGAAALCRLLVCGAPPHLSDDLYRYLWEGLALNHGIDVFSTAPGTVTGLDDALASSVNHGDLGSIYPPYALGWFRLLALVGTDPWVAQAGASLADLATVGWMLRSNHRLAAWVWALHPLPVLEAASGAHLESLGVSVTVAAVVSSRPWVTTTLLGVAGGIKLLPLLILPAWLRRRRQPRDVFMLLAVAAMGFVLIGPARRAGTAALDSLRAYGSHWSFNGLAYTLVHPLLQDWTRPLLMCVGALAVLAAMRHRDPRLVWRDAALAFIVLTPTAHPWYGLWLLAPALLVGDATGILLASAMPTSYLVLATLDVETGSWSEGPWLWGVTWLPALAVVLWRWRTRSRAVLPPTSE